MIYKFENTNNLKLFRFFTKILTRFNFIEEGTLKRHYFTNGIYEDSILLAKLAESNFN